MQQTTSKPNDSESLQVSYYNLPYLSDPIEYQQQLTANHCCSLLLESAEIQSKQNLKSLLITDTALRIHCLDDQIELLALTENGQTLLAQILGYLAYYPQFNILIKEKCQLMLHFVSQVQHVEERQRLMQPSVFDLLRLIQHHFGIQNKRNNIMTKNFATEQLNPNFTDNALFIGGLFGYDLVAQYEQLPDVAQNQKCPDYLFFVAENLLIIDHQKQQTLLQNTLFQQRDFTEMEQQRLIQIQSVHRSDPRLHHSLLETLKEQTEEPNKIEPNETENQTINVSISDDDYCQIVQNLKQHIVAGDIFQVVPSRTFSMPCTHPLSSYKQLKYDNPSPYMFYLKDRDFILFGASPESALKYDHQTNQVEIYPIAGTRARGKNKDGSINLDLDGRIELELRCDEKENAEHIMLVDLARNDIAKICIAGTRYVADLLSVDRYSHVMHLVSRVVGQLDPQLDALHAYQASMNMGTLTGAPKVKAMQLIREVEQLRRGSYGGAVGYFNGKGDLDSCIVIRSAYIEKDPKLKKDIAYVQAGAGVVYDSDPIAEMKETKQKAQAVLNAILKANRLNLSSNLCSNDKDK